MIKCEFQKASTLAPVCNAWIDKGMRQREGDFVTDFCNNLGWRMWLIEKDCRHQQGYKWRRLGICLNMELIILGYHLQFDSYLSVAS